MVKNLISNYIHHEAVTFDDINPQWINKNGKEVIVEKNEMYKRYFFIKNNPISPNQSGFNPNLCGFFRCLF